MKLMILYRSYAAHPNRFDRNTIRLQLIRNIADDIQDDELDDLIQAIVYLDNKKKSGDG